MKKLSFAPRKNKSRFFEAIKLGQKTIETSCISSDTYTKKTGSNRKLGSIIPAKTFYPVVDFFLNLF